MKTCIGGTLAIVNDDDLKARAVRILVRSLYRELMAQGFDDRQIIAVATELVGKVADRLAQARVGEVADTLSQDQAKARVA